ncbi:haloacid dehalogenase type II [Albidovulum sp.]|jgi:2-haloacid dehalogenase|uniref:haloacid dehalogenase type II n=1 Tax=Albidovulum sp. TaxID=1872424 RepID=UPI0039B8D341
MTISTCIFDAYGTLFDVTAAARTAAAEPGREALAALWPRLAEDWRRKQLEYSWLRTVMGRHADFRTVTADALDWALEAAGLADAGLRDRLLALYRDLAAYPEVPAVLAALKRRGLATAILSNGSPDMLAAAVHSAGIGGLLDDVLSVESVGVFKPDPRVYGLVAERFGPARDAVLFVSANGWDAAGAAAYGFRTAWVNRAHLPVDRLPARPHHVVADLTPIPDLARP